MIQILTVNSCKQINKYDTYEHIAGYRGHFTDALIQTICYRDSPTGLNQQKFAVIGFIGKACTH